MQNKIRFVLSVFVAAFLASVTFSPLTGQRAVNPEQSFVAGTHLGVGYVMNAPDQLVGLTAFTVGSKWSGWGAFADAKFTSDRPTGDDDFREDMTAAEAEAMGDERFAEPDEVWETVNVGLVRAVSHDVAIYAGAGYSNQTVYQEYVESETGPDRFYTVEDDRVGGNTVNVMGGLYFRVGRVITFQFGGETAPGGFTLGVNFMIPVSG